MDDSIIRYAIIYSFRESWLSHSLRNHSGLKLTENKQKVLTQANDYHSMKEDPLKVQNINELKSPTLGNRNNFGLKFLNFWQFTQFYTKALYKRH